MAQVDPFVMPLPRKLAADPELNPWFTFLQRVMNDLWVRTGGGTDTIAGTALLTGTQEFSGANTFSGSVNLDGISLQVDGVAVVGPQQTAVADAAGATATNPTAPAAYSAPASGVSPVTSNDPGDFTAAATALAGLRNEVATYEAAISALVVDVASIRSQLNTALARLRTHGLIDT